jgi:hypothetical protein
MEDILTKKIEKIHHFIVFYRTFFFITSTATVAISVIIKFLFEDDKFFISKFLDNWHTKPILDITTVSSDYNCPKGFLEENLAQWPYSTYLCDCRSSFFYSTTPSSQTIKPYKCNLLYKILGCSDIEEFRKFEINVWEGNKICTKRDPKDYLHFLLKNDEPLNFTCNLDCSLVDSLGQKICLDHEDKCVVGNKKLENLNIIRKSSPKMINYNNFTKKEKNSSLNNNNSTTLQIKSNRMKLLRKNYTTYEDIESIYEKTFNISFNNKVLNQFSVSNLLISENFPCLIDKTHKSQNELWNFYGFVLENIDFLKLSLLKKDNEKIEIRENSIKERKSESNQNFEEKNQKRQKQSQKIEVNLTNFDKNDCIFYENTYYDKRFYFLDILNYYQFLMSDLGIDSITFNNVTVGYEKFSEYENFTPLTTLFFLSDGFNGWNMKLCTEDPGLRMEGIIFLYNKAAFHLDLVMILKILSFLYLFLIGLFQNFFEQYHFSIKDNLSLPEKKSYNIYLDLIYYFINVLNICSLIQICFTIKNISHNNYLFLIKSDCMDSNSTKTLNYLLDICEEKFIYCVFMTCFNILEFLFFSIILKHSYAIRLSIGTETDSQGENS